MSRKRFSVKDSQLQESIGNLLQEQNHIGEGRLETLPIESVHTAEENPRYVGRVLPQEIIQHRQGLIDLSSESGDRAEFFLGVQDLANSIARHGLLQPIIVREDQAGFRILAGERRLLAHLLLGKERIRAIVRPAALDVEERSIRLIENLQRENLSFAELIRGIEELDRIYQQQHGRAMDSTDLAAELQKHDSTCRRYLQVMRAPSDIRHAIDNGKITGLRPALALIEIENIVERTQMLARLDTEALVEADIRQPVVAPKESVSTEPRRGRKRRQISLGTVKDSSVIQRIAQAMLSEKAYEQRFGRIDWNDLDQVQNLWEDTLADIQRGIT